MKTNNFLRITLLAASLSIFFACKKDSSSSTSAANSTTSVETSADDQTMVSNENDAVSNDATAALNANASIAGSAAVGSTAKSSGTVLGDGGAIISICDATVTYDTTSTIRTITIVYNGSNCLDNRTRTGKVIISIPQGQHWRDVNAMVNIKIDTLTITRVRDGKTIILNGSKTITNTSGGLLVDLAGNNPPDNIIHNITDTMAITFANGNVRSWQSSKQRTFTYSSAGFQVSTTGTGVVGSNSNVAEWGTNRFGVGFQNMITSPKVIAQACNFGLVSGQDSSIRTDNITTVITYGLDASGNPLTACPTGYFYAELVWSNGNNGKQYTFIYPY